MVVTTFKKINSILIKIIWQSQFSIRLHCRLFTLPSIVLCAQFCMVENCFHIVLSIPSMQSVDYQICCNRFSPAMFKGSTTLNARIMVFWDITLCSGVNRYWLFQGMYSLYLQGLSSRISQTLKMKKIHFFEAMVSGNSTTQHNISEVSILSSSLVYDIHW
jgi:hypothetical protein